MRMKRIFSLLCAAAITLSAGTAPAYAEGEIPEAGAQIETYAVSGDFEYETNATGITITKYNGSGGEVTIPAEIDGKKVTAIGDDAFNSNNSITAVIIPEGVTAIYGEYKYEGVNVYSEYGSFACCSYLQTVQLPSTLTSIGDNAFSCCSKLTNITIPNNVTLIGDGAFYSCPSIANLTIPNSVKSIGGGAFYNCRGFTNIVIPNSVTSIGDCAFGLCTNLTSITISSSVNSIGEDPFELCKNLTSILVDPDNPSYLSVDGVLYSKDMKTLVRFPEGRKDEYYTIPDGVTVIGNSAFYNCKYFTNITIPDGVTSIGDDAFHGCLDLENITIPNGVTSIGGHAFGDCESFTKIIIPDSVSSIGEWAFYGCTWVKDITISNKVTSIEEQTFSCCFKLEKITIPSSVTSIEPGAFWGADDLTIYGYAKSYAEAYANGKNIPFVAIGEVPAAPTFTPDGGTFTEAQTVTIECTTTGAEIYYTLDGSEPTASSTKYTAPVSITESATLKAVSIKDGLSSDVTSAEFTINASVSAPSAPSAPTFTPDGGTFTEAQTVTIECTTEGAEIYYTLDGSVPTASSTKYTTPVSITESATLKAVSIKDEISSDVTSAEFTVNISESEKSGFYSDDTTLSEAALNEIVTQKTEVKNEKYDVRFVQKVNADTLAGKSKATFTLTSSKDGSRTVSTTKYYTGLTFDDGTSAKAENGQAFLCYTVTGVPENVTVTADRVVLE